MDGGNIASIIAAVIALVSSLAVSRSSRKAAEKAKTIEAETARESSRSIAEEEAFVRARAFDTETIARQNTKIQELEQALAERESELGQVRTDNLHLHNDVRMTHRENRELQDEVSEKNRIIENLRRYIHHVPPVPGELPPELETEMRIGDD